MSPTDITFPVYPLAFFGQSFIHPKKQFFLGQLQYWGIIAENLDKFPVG